MEADASRFKRVKGSEIDWTDGQRAQRPIREYLAALDGENVPINSECVMLGERRDRILVAPGREIGEAKIRALPSVGLQYGHARRKSSAEEAYQSARSRPHKLPDHCAPCGLIATMVLSSMSMVKTTFSPGSKPSSNAAESTL